MARFIHFYFEQMNSKTMPLICHRACQKEKPLNPVETRTVVFFLLHCATGFGEYVCLQNVVAAPQSVTSFKKIGMGFFFLFLLNQLQIVIVNLNELKIFVKSEKSNNKTFSFCVILIKVGGFG